VTTFQTVYLAVAIVGLAGLYAWLWLTDHDD